MKAEKESFRRVYGFDALYNHNAEAFRITYQELLDAPSLDLPDVLDREALNGVGFLIGEQALLIGLLHQIGELRDSTLENCIQTMLDLLHRFFLSIHRALFIADYPITRTLCESITELKGCTGNFLKCTVCYGPSGYLDDCDGVLELAMKVFNAYKSFINNPRTMYAVTWVSILEVVNKVDDALPVIEIKMGLVFVKPNEDDRPVKEMTRLVVSNAISVIKELPHFTKIQSEADSQVMEGLLMKTISMRDRVNEMKDSVWPLREGRILESLKGIRASSKYMKEKLQHYWLHDSEEFTRKIDILRESVSELKDAIMRRLQLN